MKNSLNKQIKKLITGCITMVLLGFFIFCGCAQSSATHNASTVETLTGSGHEMVRDEELLTVIYPNVNNEGSNSFGYAALKLALDKSGVPYELTLSKDPMNNDRIRYNIEQGTISISDFGTCTAYEKDLLAVPFPIDMGLNGWRVPVVIKSNADLFSNTYSLETLQKYVAAQGTGWPDTEILKASELIVMESPNLESLFSMLEQNRFNYVPLGANEAQMLIDTFNASDALVVEENLLITYPFARFFFVKKDNQVLYDAVYNGLVTAFDDGSFMELFNSHPSNQWIMDSDNLKDRTIITIDNPLATPLMDDIPTKYFYKNTME